MQVRSVCVAVPLLLLLLPHSWPRGNTHAHGCCWHAIHPPLNNKRAVCRCAKLVPLRSLSYVGGAAAAAAVDYSAGGYWGLQPAVRVAMLHALVHDALETDELR